MQRSSHSLRLGHMQKIIILFLLITSVIYISCKKDDVIEPVTVREENSSEYLSNDSIYQILVAKNENHLNQDFDIDTAYYKNEKIIIQISYTGGCIDPEFILCEGDSTNGQKNFILFKSYKDDCKAIKSKTFTINFKQTSENEYFAINIIIGKGKKHMIVQQKQVEFNKITL